MGFLKFLLLALVFSVQLRTEYAWLYWPEVAISALGLLSFILPNPFLILGFALCVLPYFEYGTLSCFLLTFNFGVYLKNRKPNNVSEFSLLLLLPLTISLSFCLIQEIDYYILKTIFTNDGFYGLFLYVKQNYPVWYRAIFAYATFLNFLILVSLAPAQLLKEKSFITGLSLGVLVSCLVGIAQLFELAPVFSLNREVFWLHVRRYEGTFTDPNALGVMSALLVPYFYYMRANSKLTKISGISLACFSIFSESRTFWLAMFAWFIIENIKNPKILSLLIAPLLLVVPKVNQFFQGTSLFDRFDRILQTLNLDTFYDSLYSRLLMGEIALRTWKANPLFGVGLERFYVVQDKIAKSANLDLGQWRDNANNFYLQIAAEQGLVGSVLFLILFIYLFRKAKKQSSDLSKMLLLILAVIFFTGPHLYFEEVKYFVALIIASILGDSLNNKETGKFLKLGALPIFSAMTFVLGISLLLIFKTEQRPLIGFWPLENSEDGTVAWSSLKAKMKLCNVPEGQKISYRTYNLPMSFSLIQNNIKSEIEIQNTEWQNFELDKSDLINLEITPSKVWKPGEHDGRWLGIMLKIPDNLCN